MHKTLFLWAVMGLSLTYGDVIPDFNRPSPFPVASKPEEISARLENNKPSSRRQQIVQVFQSQYSKAGQPKLLLVVNRDLSPSSSSRMEEIARHEVLVHTQGDVESSVGGINVQIGSNNQNGGAKEKAKDANKEGEKLLRESSYRHQTIPEAAPTGVKPVTAYETREIEEIAQKPFFDADAKWVDARTAKLGLKASDSTQKNSKQTLNDEEHYDLSVLKQSADVAVEILVREHTITVPEISGEDRLEKRAELVATATRLKDGVKLAQVSSDSLFGLNQKNGVAQQNRINQMTSAEMIEEVSLALMEQMGRHL